jgi:hypothetical protein
LLLAISRSRRELPVAFQPFPNAVLTIPEDDQKIVWGVWAVKNFLNGFSVNNVISADTTGLKSSEKRFINRFIPKLSDVVAKC